MPVAGLRFPRLRRAGAVIVPCPAIQASRAAWLGSVGPGGDVLAIQLSGSQLDRVPQGRGRVARNSADRCGAVSFSVSALTHVCEGGLTQLLFNPLI